MRHKTVRWVMGLLALGVLTAGCEASPTPTPTATATPPFTAVPAVPYEIVEVQDASHKALEGSLSQYTTAELDALPWNKKFIYRVVVSSLVTQAQVAPTVDEIISTIARQDADIDEISLFLYSDIDLSDGGYDVGVATWAPLGELGNMTARIASSNDRSDYRTVITLRKDLDQYLLQRSKREDRFGFSEETRRAIFKEIVAAEDRARNEADAMYSPFTTESETLTKNIDLHDALADQYRAEVRDKHAIDEDVQREITREAFEEGWPLD